MVNGAFFLSSIMASFSPPTCTHLEFTSINQSVTVVNTEVDQYKVSSGTYRTSNNNTFPDLVITCNDTNVWSYSSVFKYSVNRKSYYAMYHEDTNSLSTHSVTNIPKLPDVYDVLYQVDNPERSMNVYFDLVGQQRHATRHTDPQTGVETLHWGQWYEWTQTYTITITTNINKHCQLIQQAASNGSYARLSDSLHPVPAPKPDKEN